MRFARLLVVLELDPLAPRAPRLPHRRWGPLAQLTAAAVLHVTLLLIVAVIETTLTRGIVPRLTAQTTEVRHVVFLPSEMPRTPTGGGGGGNQRQDAIRRAQGVGADAITLRAGNRPAPTAPVAAPSAAAVEDVALLPSILLDAKPLTSGLFDQSGLPTGAVMSGTSTGSGSGGGGGTGTGTGTGSGRGPGFGPGSGGGTGGGVYRAGGEVSAPRPIKEVRPKYTGAALINKIQGTVVLEAVVTADGCASQIRIVRSLDPGGLDEEAVAAVAQWRFEPGRLRGAPVDVLVTIVLSFSLR
jgi:TonB family protein